MADKFIHGYRVIGEVETYNLAGRWHGPVMPLEYGPRMSQISDKPDTHQARPVDQLDQVIKQYAAAHQVDYLAAVTQLRAAEPELFKAVYGGGK